jgi:ATP-dependent DNA helicase RecQ
LAQLREVFGYPDFRGLQAEIVEHVIDGGDALVLMPTGGGKSLCFQLPALVRDGVAVVVSPLIALMQDQVAALRQLGIRAAALNSAVPPAEVAQATAALREGELDLVYVAPERLLTEPFLELLERVPLALFAIDEAHCVSQWGHDFRPEYRELTVLHRRWPAVPRIALTATADGPTRDDIVERLELGQGRVFVAGFDRPNIRYQVVLKDGPRAQLKRFLEAEHRGHSGIVYCGTRRRVEETAAWLRDQGWPALPYHAGLEPESRERHQRRFVEEDGVVIVATIAFGMGIDKPDVRFVAHLDLPKSVEAYYQETGRAGRDGLAADAWMTYGAQDAGRLRHFIESSDAPAAQQAIEHRKLNALLGYAETARCRRQVLLDYFGERYPRPCGNCDCCLEPVETFDGTEAAQKALSCVYRTGQRFGAAHLIDILTGNETDRVRGFGHEALSTFAVGGEHEPKEWRSIFRQLVAQGLLVVDVAGHGGLSLGPEAEVRPVLRGERAIELRRDPSAKRPRKAKPARARVQLDGAGDEALFQALRAKRLALAKAQGVPPYVVFHDATLAEIASRRPASLDALAEVSGVGAAKLDRYGAAVLAVVEAHENAD